MHTARQAEYLLMVDWSLMMPNEARDTEDWHCCRILDKVSPVMLMVDVSPHIHPKLTQAYVLRHHAIDEMLAVQARLQVGA